LKRRDGFIPVPKTLNMQPMGILRPAAVAMANGIRIEILKRLFGHDNSINEKSLTPVNRKIAGLFRGRL
jgi:hypothetical protein